MDTWLRNMIETTTLAKINATIEQNAVPKITSSAKADKIRSLIAWLLEAV